MGPKSGLRNRLFRAVHAEAKTRHLDHDALHDMCREKFGAASMSSLTEGQLLTIYRELTGHGLKRRVPLPARGEVSAAAPAVMATAADLELFESECARRSLGKEGQRNLIRRQLRGRTVLRTRRDVVRVTAAVRAMNRRDGLA